MGKKYVNVRRHPSKDYELKCYNKKAFFDKHWTDETINARGHVYASDGSLLSSPFPKFFNINENEHSLMTDVAQKLYHDFERIVKLPKYNGHLAIVFHDGEEWVNTTKGSFDHDFVELDRLVIEESGFTEAVLDKIPTEWTLCFEIIADYDPHLMTQKTKEDFNISKDFAILLGVNNRDKDSSIMEHTWAPFFDHEIQNDSGGELLFAKNEQLNKIMKPFASVEEAENWLNLLKEEKDCEGFIIHDVIDDWRIKIKTDWFVYERYKFQFNANRTRNIFSKYFDSEKAFGKIPEEFHNRYRKVLNDYAVFLDGIEANMMQSFERMYEGGLKMKHEIEQFINTNEKLTSTERDVMLAYMSNIGYQGRAFDMFCETYKGFSLVDKKE